MFARGKNIIELSSINRSKDPEAVMAELDRWVANQGNGQYVPSDVDPYWFKDPLALGPDYGIQQVRSELTEFVEEIIKRKISGITLEIGLGKHGSTHFLWRQLFDRVITIERNFDRCTDFATAFCDFSNTDWQSIEKHSGFIAEESSKITAVGRAYDALTQQKVGLLFIDGDHGLQGVLCDWLLYHNLVKPNGIVAFHDVVQENTGLENNAVPKFLEKLQSGEIDGKIYNLHKIVHSCFGISFYVVEGN